MGNFFIYFFLILSIFKNYSGYKNYENNELEVYKPKGKKTNKENNTKVWNEIVKNKKRAHKRESKKRCGKLEQLIYTIIEKNNKV